MVVDNIFIYHLDYEVEKLFSLNSKSYDSEKIYEAFNLATRVAFLLSKNHIYVPASNYFESAKGFKIINSLSGLNELDYIKLVSSSHNIREFLEKKKVQHSDNFYNEKYYYKEFDKGANSMTIPATMVKRTNSASEDIENALQNIDENDQFWKRIFEFSEIEEWKSFIKVVKDLHILMAGKAYISKYVVELLQITNSKKEIADTLLNEFITQNYILSFIKEYNAFCLSDIPFIDTMRLLGAKNKIRCISYKEYMERIMRYNYKQMRLVDYISSCSAEDLCIYKKSKHWLNIISNSQIVKTKNTNKQLSSDLEKKINNTEQISTKLLSKHIENLEKEINEQEDVVKKYYRTEKYFIIIMDVLIFILITIVTYQLWIDEGNSGLFNYLSSLITILGFFIDFLIIKFINPKAKVLIKRHYEKKYKMRTMENEKKELESYTEKPE